MVDPDQGITIGEVLLAFLGILLVPILLDMSARLTGFIFLVAGIFILLSIYSPSTLIAILSLMNVHVQYAELASTRQEILQEGATYLGSFLVGTGLGLLFFYPALRRPACRRK